MSEASDMLLEAHRELIADGHGSNITAGAVTRAGILTPAVMSETLRKSGQMLQITQTAEIENGFMTDLGIGDRSEIAVAGQPMKVMVIESEPASPTTLLHLKPEY